MRRCWALALGRSWTCALALALAACAHTPQAPQLSPLEQARQALESGRSAQAYRQLWSLHQRSPDDLEVARYLAEAAARAGTAEELKTRVHAEQARGDAAVEHYILGLLSFALNADARGPALAELQRAAQLDPGSAELHYRLGLALLVSEQYPQSVPELQRAVDLDPSRQAMKLPLAKALAHTGHTPEATALLAQVVAGQPTAAEIKTARELMDRMSDPFAGFPAAAQSRLEAGLNFLKNADLPDQAIQIFQDIQHDYPDLAVVHALLGLSYERLDDPGRAIEELRKATQLAPLNGKNYLYLGDIYFSRQRPDAARPCFEKALELNPLLDEAYERLGDITLDRRELPAAVRMFRTLLNLKPQAVAPRVKLASALQLQNDLPGAERELLEGLKLSPDSLELKLRLGLVYLDERTQATNAADRQRAGEQAGRWLREVVQAQPQNALASRALASLSGADAR